MLAAPKTLPTRVSRSAVIKGATILMPRHAQLAGFGCRSPGIPQTLNVEMRVMPPSEKK